MTTTAQARAIVRGRIETAGLAVPLRWQNEDKDFTGSVELPDTPSAFVYTEFLSEGRAGIAGFGGGRGSNLYRNPFASVSYVFVPKGAGLDQAESLAEQIAARLRSYRDSSISCFDATVYPGGDGADLKPPGLSSAVGDYFWACAEIVGGFDQIG